MLGLHGQGRPARVLSGPLSTRRWAVGQCQLCTLRTAEIHFALQKKIIIIIALSTLAFRFEILRLQCLITIVIRRINIFPSSFQIHNPH